MSVVRDPQRDPQRDLQPDLQRGGLADPLLGRLLDRRYLIGTRIARGGMASVYTATDTRLDREVAVKVMHAGLGGDQTFTERFVREAKAAARLSHPNVVGVFDQGQDGDVVYLAMEYVPGRTLRDVIAADSPMAPPQALALIEPILSALAAAHRSGLIHRDIKPENVLIADDGRIKVADFGLAKAISADTSHTVTGGVLIGTVSYMAPELVVEGTADARADVYAVGVVLYELLTGHKPHAAESPIQVAYKHVHEDVPAPSAAVSGIPPYLDALIARATARDRSHRPADASVLLHQVHRVSHALSEGADDDAELTADLTPFVGAVEADTLVPVETEPSAIIPIEADGFGELPSATPEVTASDPTEPARSRRPRRSRRGPIVFVLALLLAAGLGAGAWWFGEGRYTQVPGVLGLSEADAVERLTDAGLRATVGDPAYSETVTAGRVIGSDPEPGGRVLSGGEVTVTVSLGKERYDVPDLVGKTENKAQDAITAANLSFARTVRAYDESVRKGRVISSDPPAGQRVRAATAVTLTISRGPRPVKVPDWTGRDATRAAQAFTKKGFTVDRSERFDDTVPEGRVISQTPSSGTLFRGDQVRLVVSLGPELVEVPRGLVGSGVDAAEEKLRSLGFAVDIQQSDSYIGLQFVLRVEPGSGDLVPKGSTITLYLV